MYVEIRLKCDANLAVPRMQNIAELDNLTMLPAPEFRPKFRFEVLGAMKLVFTTQEGIHGLSGSVALISNICFTKKREKQR